MVETTSGHRTNYLQELSHNKTGEAILAVGFAMEQKRKLTRSFEELRRPRGRRKRYCTNHAKRKKHSPTIIQSSEQATSLIYATQYRSNPLASAFRFWLFRGRGKRIVGSGSTKALTPSILHTRSPVIAKLHFTLYDM